MSSGQLRELLRQQPFRPFRLVLSNGRTYDIAGSEWMVVMGGTTVVGIPGAAGDGDVVSLIDNDHISNIEPLAPAEPRASA